MSEHVIKAITNEELAELPVHDQWMAIDECQLSPNGDVSIPILIDRDQLDDDIPSGLDTSWRRFIWCSYTTPRLRSTLVIEGAADYRIEDRAKIGGAHLNRISFTACSSSIMAKKTFPAAPARRASRPLRRRSRCSSAARPRPPCSRTSWSASTSTTHRFTACTASTTAAAPRSPCGSNGRRRPMAEDPAA